MALIRFGNVQNRRQHGFVFNLSSNSPMANFLRVRSGYTRVGNRRECRVTAK